MSQSKRDEILYAGMSRVHELSPDSREIVTYCLDQVLYGASPMYHRGQPNERPTRDSDDIDLLLTVTVDHLNHHPMGHARISVHAPLTGRNE